MEAFLNGKKKYQKLVKDLSPKPKKLKNLLVSFLSGGVIGLFSVAVSKIFICNGIAEKEAFIWTLIIIIFLACLATGLGFFDRYVEKFQSGLSVPITGFAHSVTSSVMDYRKDGLVTGVGSNVFKLAGTVILYGIVAAFFFCLIKVIIYG